MMIRTILLILTASMALTSARADVEFLWGVSGPTGSGLFAINPTNGAVLGLIGTPGINLSGLAVKNGVLLATQPNMSPAGGDPKRLVAVNKSTAAVTAIGVAMDQKYAISDVALRADGTLFAWGPRQGVKKLLTIDTTTAAVTELGSNVTGTSEVALAFDGSGNLFMVRTNGLFKISQVNGSNLNGNGGAVIALTGATNQFDNFMATNAAGEIIGGLRAGGGTQLFALNPLTGVTTLRATVPGISLTGMAFDVAAAPTVKVSGKKTQTAKKATYTLKGTASSLLPLTVKVKAKSAKVVKGKWTLTLPVRRGKNVITVVCADGMGQSAKAKVTVTRK